MSVSELETVYSKTDRLMLKPFYAVLQPIPTIIGRLEDGKPSSFIKLNHYSLGDRFIKPFQAAFEVKIEANSSYSLPSAYCKII